MLGLELRAFHGKSSTAPQSSVSSPPSTQLTGQSIHFHYATIKQNKNKFFKLLKQFIEEQSVLISNLKIKQYITKQTKKQQFDLVSLERKVEK